MKGKISILCLVFVLLFTMSTLALTEEELADLPEMEMTFAHNAVADPTMHNQGPALAFKKYVEDQTNGKITVNISPGGALGGTASLQEQTMTGAIEVSCSHTEGTIAMVYPKIQVISIPYLFRSVDHALSVFESDIGQEMFEELKNKTGLRVIGFWDNGGFRNFTNNKRPVRNAEDMEGLSIRTMEIPAHMKLVEALGASATPIGWEELYSSLQTGVVDGQENSIPVILGGSLQEVQKYLTLDGHVYSQIHLLANNEWFNDLPLEYQRVIEEAGYRAQVKGREVTRILRDRGLSEIAANNTEIYDPTPEEMETFREASQDVVREYIEDQIGEEFVNEFVEAAEEKAEFWKYE